MDNLIPDNEYTEVEGRLYANPQVSIDETNTFIDNLRSTQGRQNQEILQQTQMLGTDVPSNLGGLTGAESYFTSRYQTPQTNSVVANLRATAQAAALNQALENEQAMWKKRYQDAYRNYQKSSYNKAYSSGGNSGSNNGNTSTWSGETTRIATDDGVVNSDNGAGNGGKTSTPPNPEEYYIDGAEQTERIQERTGLPDWLINAMKIFG